MEKTEAQVDIDTSFDFYSLVSYEEINLSDERPREDLGGNVIMEDRVSEYEKLWLIKYQTAAYKTLLTSTHRNIGFYKILKSFFCSGSSFLFDRKTLNKFESDKADLEHKINEVPYVHKFRQFSNVISQKFRRKMGWEDLYDNKEIVELIESFIKKYVELLENKIATIEAKKKIRKEYYSRNLEIYMDIIGVKNTKERDVIRFLCYQGVACFYYQIVENFSKDTIKAVCGLNEKEFRNIASSDTLNMAVESILGKGSGRKLILPKYELLTMIYGIEGTEEYFINSIIKKLSPTNFTLKDFEHVKQSEYIKSILENAIKTRAKGINILIYGRAGTGKTEFAKTLIKETKADGYEVAMGDGKMHGFIAGTPLCRIRDKDINSARSEMFKTLSTSLKNTNNAVIFFDEAEDFFRKNEIADQSKQTMNDILENNSTPVIWTCNELSPVWLEKSFIRRFTYAIELDKVNTNTLIKLTRKICEKNKIKINNKIEEFIKQEQPSIGLIEKAIESYKLSGFDDIERLYVGLKDIIYAQNYAGQKPKDINRNQTHDYNQKLANTDIPLDSITNGIIKSGKNDWSLILYGVSGTGKTAYVDFLGKKLGKKVIKKKVSDLQSMWVGECEKNINEAFEQARNEDAILLFDEGDSWLRDRRFNHASWETSQTNQFLQNLESATSPVVVTTNLMNSLDQAALRRFVFKVKFKYMTKAQVKEAFKTFYGLDVSDEIANISYATPGDFAVIQKQLEYLGEKPTANKIKELLIEEIKNKKDDSKDNGISF